MTSSVTMNLSQLVSKYSFLLERTKILEEMANSRSIFQVENIHNEHWTSLCYQKSKKLSKINRTMSKLVRNKLEDIPTGQRWDNLSINTNSSCNYL